MRGAFGPGSTPLHLLAQGDSITRGLWWKSVLPLFLAVPGMALAEAPPARPAQIVLFRHADKPDDRDDPHLSPEGVARAALLVPFITTDPLMTRYGAPAALYATGTTKHDDGQRTQETVAPLARELKLPVQTPFLGKRPAELARHILGSPALAGKTVIICWNHEHIPELAAALGVDPPPRRWKGKVYDRVYVITYPDGKASLSETHYGGK